MGDGSGLVGEVGALVKDVVGGEPEGALAVGKALGHRGVPKADVPVKGGKTVSVR